MRRSTLLTAETAPRYAGLALPRYRNALHRVPLAESLIAIGVAYLGVPVGLILAGVYKGADDNSDGQASRAQILSLSVVATHRSKGVAQQLLAMLQDQLIARQCQQVDLYYVDGKTTTPALEHLLAKAGWAAPKPITVVAHSDLNHVREQLISLEYPLPADAELFAWSDLTEADQREIERRESEAGGWYSRSTYGSVSPFTDPDQIDQSSVGVRYKGSVVGWMITHRISVESIRYTSLFVSPEVRQLNLGIMLILSALKRQDAHWQATGEAPKGYFQTAVDNRWMRQFIQMSAPLWFRVDEYKVASKRLGATSATLAAPLPLSPDSYADTSAAE